MFNPYARTVRGLLQRHRFAIEALQTPWVAEKIDLLTRLNASERISWQGRFRPALHAAQKLGRQWIGIDRFPLAIALSDKRLTDAFPGMHYDLHGTNGNVTAFST